MAERITDPRWPAGSDVDFDAVFKRLVDLKLLHFPQHTARDKADPLIQVLMLIAALGQNALHRANHALKQLDPSTVTSRRALITLLEVVNRPLLPMQPSRGKVYGKLSGAPVAETVVIAKGTKFIQPGIQDPVFSVDSDIETGSSIDFSAWFYDSSAGSATQMTLGTTTVTFDDGDSIIIGFENLTYSEAVFTVATTLTTGCDFIALYYNKEWGAPDLVHATATQLYHYIDTYLHADTVDDVNFLDGITVTIKYKPTNTVETVVVDIDAGRPRAITTKMGQSSTSESTSDYEVLAYWRPVSNPVSTPDFSTSSGIFSIDITNVLSSTDWWEQHDTYGYAVMIKHVSGSGSLPESLKFTSIDLVDGDFYAIAKMTQGVLKKINIGSTDGTSWQHIAIASDPIVEPVEDPELVLSVGGDTDWFVQDDFSASGPTSKHAIFREDTNDGWGIVFGDGSIGRLPTEGSAVVLTYRTGSTNPGDIEGGTTLKALNAISATSGFVMPRATVGWVEPEASTKESVIAFRNSVLPQLALRADSVVTPDEIVAAMTGGAKYRATFKTSDGRTPFSRAHYSTTGAGDRQYIVVVVGDPDDADGAVHPDDLDEAETWLNGETIGVEIVGGHAPQNTEGLVYAFTPMALLPTIAITVSETTGVRNEIETVIREFLQPHATDDAGDYRFDFGGTFPVALLFGAIWDAIPKRTSLTVSISDGVTTYTLGSDITFDEFELPILDATFDPSVNITVSSS